MTGSEQQIGRQQGKSKPALERNALARILPHFVRWLRWSGRWLRGLVPEPYSAAMFHSNPRARTATQELGTRCLVNRPTSASPPHVRTEYAQNTPEAVPRGCHEARTAMYGHCDGVTRAKPKSCQKFFGGGVAYRTPLRIRPHLPTLLPFIRASPARDGSSRGLCCCMLWPLLRLSTTRAARSCSTAADVAV